MFTLNRPQNFTLIHPYPICRYVYMESPSDFHPYLALIPLTDMFTWNRFQNFTLIHPYPTWRHVSIESPSEFHPYSPLSHLKTCLHGITIRILPLFALIPLTVISRKFLIKYYEDSFDYLIIIMDQLRLTRYLVYRTVCSLPDTDLQNLLSSQTPTPPQDNSDRSLITPVRTC